MAFEHQISKDVTDFLYLTDFDAGTTSQIVFTTSAAPTTPVTLSQPLNPSFSSDGRWIVFTAATYSAAYPQGRRDIYISTPTGAHLTNLTASQNGTLPKYDARFSIVGSDVVYDQLGYTNPKNTVSSIYKMTLNLPVDNNTDPSIIVQPVQVLFDNVHQYSGPTYSPTERYLFYSQSTTGYQSVWRYDNLLHTQTAISDNKALQAYLPGPIDLTTTMYISWTTKTGNYDQIFIRTPAVSSASKILPLNDPNFDTSDFATYDEDTIIFSSDRCGDAIGTGVYKFFIGSITTGQYWRLDEDGANSVQGPILGQSYTQLPATD